MFITSCTFRIHVIFFFFFSSRRRHTRLQGDWSSDVCSSDLTAPSIFTTPSAVMSPTTRMPVPMMDSPASVSGTPCPFSVKIAMSILLFHDGEGIERFALATDFEVERSEEHTSELQSPCNLVCRLLLEKKKHM